jgi:3-hydroxyacyl-CoA dehydrogenase
VCSKPRAFHIKKQITMSRFQVKKVAVLGAGVMGAQIAAHLVNVRVPVVLFDLPAKEGPKNGIVMRAIDNLKKLKPAPLADVADAGLIEQANYETDLAKLFPETATLMRTARAGSAPLMNTDAALA